MRTDWYRSKVSLEISLTSSLMHVLSASSFSLPISPSLHHCFSPSLSVVLSFFIFSLCSFYLLLPCSPFHFIQNGLVVQCWSSPTKKLSRIAGSSTHWIRHLLTGLEHLALILPHYLTRGTHSLSHTLSLASTAAASWWSSWSSAWLGAGALDRRTGSLWFPSTASLVLIGITSSCQTRLLFFVPSLTSQFLLRAKHRIKICC